MRIFNDMVLIHPDFNFVTANIMIVTSDLVSVFYVNGF